MRLSCLVFMFACCLWGCGTDASTDNTDPDQATHGPDGVESDTAVQADSCAGPTCDLQDTQGSPDDGATAEDDVQDASDATTPTLPDASDGLIAPVDAESEEETHTAPTSDVQEAGADVDPVEDVPTAEACAGDWEWLTLPVRVVLLASTEDNLTTTLTADEIPGLFDHVNGVWAQACIRFDVESISTRSATAAGEEAYLVALNDPVPGAMLGAMQLILAEEEFLEPGWNLVIIKSFGIGANGVYSEATDTVFFAQGKNPTKPTHPTILAHELGHSLGLPHYNGDGVEFNLMHAGGSGEPETSTVLTDGQMENARAVAATGDAN